MGPKFHRAESRDLLNLQSHSLFPRIMTSSAEKGMGQMNRLNVGPLKSVIPEADRDVPLEEMVVTMKGPGKLR